MVSNWLKVLGRGLIVAGLAGVPLVATAPSALAQEDLRIAVNTFATLDPLARNPISSDFNVHVSLYASLVGRAPDGSLEPGLATHWENPTTLEWVFHLRDGVVFEDGTPFDASVVVDNINARIHPETGNSLSTLGRVIEEVSAPDPQTVHVRLKLPSVEFPRLVSGVYLVDSDHLANGVPANNAVNASGPYRLVRFDPDGEAVLEANPSFYGEQPAFDTVRFVVLPQVSTVIAGLQAGELDFAEKISLQDSNQLRSNPDLTVGALSSYRTLYYRINSNREPLDNQLVRQALNYAIDKQLIIDTFVEGDIVPVGQVLNPSFRAYNPDVPAYSYDPERARQLLAEAGHPEGFPLELQLAQGQNQAGDLIAQVIADQLGAIGVNVTITVEPFQVWSERSADPARAAGLSENSFGGDGTSQASLVAFTSLNNRNHAHDPEYDRLYETFLAAETRDEADEWAYQIAAQAHEFAPAIFFYSQPRTYVTSNRVEWTPRSDDLVRPQDFRPAQ